MLISVTVLYSYIESTCQVKISHYAFGRQFVQMFSDVPLLSAECCCNVSQPVTCLLQPLVSVPELKLLLKVCKELPSKYLHGS